MDSFILGVEKLGFPLPELFAWMAALSEMIGGLLIILGMGTRFAAFLIFITMSVAAFIRHGSDPFRIKELALTYWTMAGTLILTGGGRYSLERYLSRFFSSRQRETDEQPMEPISEGEEGEPNGTL